ncbi:hypothetical protein GCM10023149_22350 [Mucilaginibacter gynuensis]|uniref:Uncharacterized protein n=1 Tax=Mucilaginibacter gynuensis TaxID=1302236 RepID=A0ABP8GD47_9SPHI
MATLKTIAPATFNTEHTIEIGHLNLWARFMNYADTQKPNHTLWFFITLMVHGVLILPIPAVLMYYFNAPVWVLAITMTCFFTNIIANMGGAGIRATLSFFVASVFIHAVLLLAFIL